MAAASMLSQHQRVRIQVMAMSGGDAAVAETPVEARKRLPLPEHLRPAKSDEPPRSTASRSTASSAHASSAHASSAQQLEQVLRAPQLLPLQCELHGLRVATRILALVCASGHGMGVDEVHARDLLDTELPPAIGGAVWSLASQHVALLIGHAIGGVWSIRSRSVGNGLRAALLSGANGSGECEHEELASSPTISPHLRPSPLD